MTIERRDNMGYAISPALIVLLVLIGALMLVLCGYAVSRLRGNADTPAGWKPRTVEQEEYMREVRVRNRQNLMGEGRRSQRVGPSDHSFG